MSLVEAVEWFLNAPPSYRAEEPSRREQLLALVQCELDACWTDTERASWEQRKELLARL